MVTWRAEKFWIVRIYLQFLTLRLNEGSPKIWTQMDNE